MGVFGLQPLFEKRRILIESMAEVKPMLHTLVLEALQIRGGDELGENKELFIFINFRF